jgi:hypothetical protein
MLQFYLYLYVVIYQIKIQILYTVLCIHLLKNSYSLLKKDSAESHLEIHVPNWDQSWIIWKCEVLSACV